jgi:hypothetical protein
MQTSQTLSADWTRVLASVEKALTEAVARLANREKGLLVATQPLPTSKPLDFAKFEDRLAAFAECPGRAEQRLEQIDGALRDGEEALRQWLSRAEAVRRKLAAWADGNPVTVLAPPSR